MKNNNDGGAIASREYITANQIALLLSTVSTLLHGLKETPYERNGVPMSDALEGESRIALEVSLMKTCDRLDRILDDKSRWGLDRVIDIEKLLDTNLRQQGEFFAEQTLSAREARRPCYIFKPTLLNTEHGWVAFYGDPADEASLVVGAGDSPAEAMASFDAAFAAKGQQPAANPPVKRKRKTK